MGLGSMRLVQIKRKTNRRGTTMIETAMVLPLFILFIFGIFEYGRYMFVRHIMDNAAREGARYAVVNTNNLTAAQVITYTTNQMAAQAQQFTSPAVVSVYYADAAGEPTAGKVWSDAPFGQAIGVRIQGNYKVILFGMLGMPSNVDLVSTALMKSEAN